MAQRRERERSILHKLPVWDYEYWLVVWTAPKNISSSVGMTKFAIPSGNLTSLWKITIYNGKNHYKWPCSIAILKPPTRIGKTRSFRGESLAKMPLGQLIWRHDANLCQVDETRNQARIGSLMNHTRKCSSSLKWIYPKFYGWSPNLPSGSQTWKWKIPHEWRFWGKSPINGSFCIAMFDYRRVFGFTTPWLQQVFVHATCTPK